MGLLGQSLCFLLENICCESARCCPLPFSNPDDGKTFDFNFSLCFRLLPCCQIRSHFIYNFLEPFKKKQQKNKRHKLQKKQKTLVRFILRRALCPLLS